MNALNQRRLPLAVFSFLLLGASLAACANERGATAESPPTGEVAMAPAVAPEMASARGFAVESKVAADQVQQPPRGQVSDAVVPSMIIRNGNVSIQVDSMELAVTAVRALASRLGGYVGNVSTSTGEYAVRSATLELKIPSARFDEALSGMAPIGKVEQSNSTAEDVGEEFVDLTARVSNSRRLEERLITLLATRTGKLEDVLAVERELARVREEIERVEGRMRFLKSRVSMSTLSVTVHEKAPIVSPDNPGQNVIADAFRNMWRNFVTFIAMIISSLGVIIPIVALLTLLGWWWRRGRPKAS